MTQSEWEVYLTGVEIKTWRKELVYISMFLFILAALIHLCIRIFLVIKLGRKEFLSKSSIVALSLVAGLSGLILVYTRKISNIKDQLHPAIALLFNLLGTSLLGYLFFSNTKALELVRKTIQRYQQSFSHFDNWPSKDCKEQVGQDKTTETMDGNLKREDVEELDIERVERRMVKEVRNNGDKNEDLIWVGFVRMVDLNQQRGRTVIVQKVSSTAGRGNNVNMRMNYKDV